jgi:hypothetical protein
MIYSGQYQSEVSRRSLSASQTSAHPHPSSMFSRDGELIPQFVDISIVNWDTIRLGFTRDRTPAL